MSNLNVTAKVRIQLASLASHVSQPQAAGRVTGRPGVHVAHWHLDGHGRAPGGAQPEGLLAAGIYRSGSWLLLPATVACQWTASRGCRGTRGHSPPRASRGGGPRSKVPHKLGLLKPLSRWSDGP